MLTWRLEHVGTAPTGEEDGQILDHRPAVAKLDYAVPEIDTGGSELDGGIEYGAAQPDVAAGQAPVIDYGLEHGAS